MLEIATFLRSLGLCPVTMDEISTTMVTAPWSSTSSRPPNGWCASPPLALPLLRRGLRRLQPRWQQVHVNCRARPLHVTHGDSQLLHQAHVYDVDGSALTPLQTSHPSGEQQHQAAVAAYLTPNTILLLIHKVAGC